MLLLRHHLLLLALGMTCLGLGSSTAQAQDYDTLVEEVRVATARLEYALEKVRKVDYPVGADDRREMRDLIRHGRNLMKRAAQMPRGNSEAVEEMIAAMADSREACLKFVESVVPVWQADRPRKQGDAYRSAFIEVLKFQDVAGDVENLRHRLSADEASRAAEITAEGESLVTIIRKHRETDHVARGDAVRQLMQHRSELSALSLEATQDRTVGYPFVELGRSRQQWTNVGHAENEFVALRARFLKPGTAHVTVRNDAKEARHLFIEMEFLTAAGDLSGDGVFETASLEEFRPGEVREVLVPIYRSVPRFWETTRSFTIYLD